ncbi:MAG: YkgJ family cysteine cluster protein [Thermodesulfatator sp.]|nr:MAG: YkgJ family cysteine cluster protein [Thermodesulfatator sp.]
MAGIKGFSELESLMAEVDQRFEEIRRSYPREVRCRKGCTDCCYAPFDLSLAEALYLARAFRLLPRRVRREVERRLEKYAKEWETKVPKPVDPFALSRVRLRCPFLDDQGLCVVYPFRPLTCRVYGLPLLVGEETVVCPRSRFEPGKTYPTVLFGEILRRLAEISEKLIPKGGNLRVSVIGVVRGGFPGAHLLEEPF